MTAGQRNCYIAIGECLERYPLEDLMYALRKQLRKRDPKTDKVLRKLLEKSQDPKDGGE